ncbi:MAG: hypothetical protein LBL47_03740, partial [Lactobacillus sp.]|nr:hypothetical protein [Lactobacillus sp.]
MSLHDSKFYKGLLRTYSEAVCAMENALRGHEYPDFGEEIEAVEGNLGKLRLLAHELNVHHGADIYIEDKVPENDEEIVEMFRETSREITIFMNNDETFSGIRPLFGMNIINLEARLENIENK